MSDRFAPSDSETNRINFSWLLRLRTGEILGQFTAVVAAVAWGFDLPLLPISGVIVVEIASNLGAWLWLRRAPAVKPTALAVVLTLDVLFFTALLSLTGGPYNPFSFLYLIQIALGAVILSPLAAFGLALLCFGAFAALFNWHIWLPLQGQELGPHEVHHLQAHVRGMWIALAVAAGFIVYFLQRVRRSLALREEELFRANDLARRNERLASLATLAAGAAHELSTPLSTIAVAARELERRMESGAGQREWLEDVNLVRAQVDRCREILTRMALSAGESSGEAPERVSAAAVLKAAIADLGAAPHLIVEVEGADGSGLFVPPRALAQALQGIVRNAQQASPGEQPVVVRARREGADCVFEVQDQGPGMDSAVAARAGEPFFTTKVPGEGMGLGLFLARTTAEQLGGRMEIDSQPGRGTRVRLMIPCAPTPGRAASEGAG
jgi:two-component system sensor histidine kinase RegB